MSQEAYDIVIVGAGAAGCVVASYLAEHTDASIALIEAGEMDRDPFIHIPAGFAIMLAHDRHVWKHETVPQHGTRRAYRSGKVLGGGSSINAMAYVRGQARDYAAWQAAVGDTGRDAGDSDDGSDLHRLSLSAYRLFFVLHCFFPAAVEPAGDGVIRLLSASGVTTPQD
jgi:choline dehydrogenase-like flavoprotein